MCYYLNVHFKGQRVKAAADYGNDDDDDNDDDDNVIQ